MQQAHVEALLITKVLKYPLLRCMQPLEECNMHVPRCVLTMLALMAAALTCRLLWPEASGSFA